jgi:hypothetical protein
LIHQITEKKKRSFVVLTKEPVISKGQFTLLAALMLGDLITNFGSQLESVVNSSRPKEIRRRRRPDRFEQSIARFHTQNAIAPATPSVTEYSRIQPE